jgi:hypothetical protein
MDTDMQHGHGHAAWTRTCSMDMDMHMQLVGYRRAVLSGSLQLFFTFTVLPTRGPLLMVVLTFSSVSILTLNQPGSG